MVSCNDIENKDNQKKETNQELVEVKPDEPTCDFSTPFYICGSSFGHFFQMMYKTGDFEKMIAFTSKESIDKFGRDNILNFYKNYLKFGYKIKQKSHTVDGDIITINYESSIIATKGIVRMNIVIENDSAKIVLPDNLKNFPS